MHFVIRKLFDIPINLLGLIAVRVTSFVNKEGKVVFNFDQFFKRNIGMTATQFRKNMEKVRE